MPKKGKGKDELIDSSPFSVGNPAIGLSDAIVGTYGRGCVCDDGGSSGGGANTGGGGNSGSSDDSGNKVVDIIKEVVGAIIDVIGRSGCCCGGGTGSLINESEIVL